jgi:hypothetical protein
VVVVVSGNSIILLLQSYHIAIVSNHLKEVVVYLSPKADSYGQVRALNWRVYWAITDRSLF